MTHKKLHLISYACGMGAGDHGTQDGPGKMQHSSHLQKWLQPEVAITWHPQVKPISSQGVTSLQMVAKACANLAQETFSIIQQGECFGVLGGDHSCGVGTWSGFSHAWQSKGPVGLIWVDAHMDSHTSSTSPTGNVHGMPVAGLLGEGESSLTKILNDDIKILPENLCLIGIRSFESGEADLLNKLNVRIFYMEEIQARGLEVVMREAIQIVTKNTVSFGISIDVDSMSPEQAPGTGTPVPDGIPPQNLFQSLSMVVNHPKWGGFEIAEFDPHKDHNESTEKIVAQLISIFALAPNDPKAN